MLTVRPQRLSGHALVSALLALLLLGAGAAATVRWSVGLSHTERLARQRLAAAQMLQSALELGTAGEMGEAGPPDAEGTPSRTVVMPDGTALRIRETRRRASDGSDPERGMHVTWSAQWQDPWGQTQTLVLRTYWATTPRIY